MEGLQKACMKTMIKRMYPYDERVPSGAELMPLFLAHILMINTNCLILGSICV